MAYAEREAFSGLKIDTILARSQSPSPARKYGEINDGEEQRSKENDMAPTRPQDEEESVMNELHNDTPPMAVPRPDDNHFPCLESDISYSHKPEEDYSSTFEDYLREHNPPFDLSSKDHTDPRRPNVLEGPLPGRDSRHTAYSQLQTRLSNLRNVQTQDQAELNYDVSDTKQRHGRQHSPSMGNGLPFSSKRDDDQLNVEDLDRPTSLTSVSTMSPLEEVRTPSEYPRDGTKEVLLSPLSSSPLIQRAASLEDPSIWTMGVSASYGSKSRSYTLEGSNSWRRAMRQGSRRSTGSSGKSPASAFLSMWTSPEEVMAPQPDDEGQMVGTDYVIGKQIGFGGFSTVKEAFKVEGNGATRRLAVKIVKKHVLGKSEQENDQVQAEFDHEVRIWRQLNDSHILSLDAVYETDYATFCFTKFAIGGTLFDLVKANRRGIDMHLAKKYAYELASALRYLHEDMRVVHRDIKLENCLLDPERAEDGSETAKLLLCDFGMAEWMATDTGGEPIDTYDNPADRPPTQNIGPSGSSTSVAGSLEYASPELLLSTSGLVDPVVDIWAFGVVVYATVVGSRPFQNGFGPRTHASILKGEWDPNAVLAGHVNDVGRRDTLQLIRHCLEMDTERRWTIRQVLDCPWFQDVPQTPEEALNESTWRL
ncbi:kinase-like domain-containing protein [Talaromyces proteolyticus]|uniref:Kinase-like domain-containing protein n=1 Tax=Talaromyces proteolyticus TaxID=1131652 RepID=A0AAD4L215_9EURO|nr:kinase-like domain-containing protein [Talaromyces proteolyticus]KAH8704100.1 kinase-like domain-containing protein [Talaromyces proteolyticus]